MSEPIDFKIGDCGSSNLVRRVGGLTVVGLGLVYEVEVSLVLFVLLLG